MRDWNVVVSIYQDGFRRAIHALEELGKVERSPYHNVLVTKVEDAISFLEAVERKTEESTALYDSISRVAPAACNFDFQSGEEFRQKASSVLREWSQQLAGRSFHVRLHRRGARHSLRTPDTEKFLDDAALAATSEIGMPAGYPSRIRMLLLQSTLSMIALVWRCGLARILRGTACYDRMSWKRLVARQRQPSMQQGVPCSIEYR